jgi:hypothetical protein
MASPVVHTPITPLLNVPNDILSHILTFTPSKDIACLALTCHTLYTSTLAVRGVKRVRNVLRKDTLHRVSETDTTRNPEHTAISEYQLFMEQMQYWVPIDWVLCERGRQRFVQIEKGGKVFEGEVLGGPCYTERRLFGSHMWADEFIDCPDFVPGWMRHAEPLDDDYGGGEGFWGVALRSKVVVVGDRLQRVNYEELV